MGNHTDSLNEGATYLFNKVRVKVMNEEKYLNTPKNEDECTISLVANFDENLKPVQNISAAKQITANIIGVTKINNYLCCCSCNESVSIKGKIACCTNCGMFMKISSCNHQWFLKLYIQDSTKPDTKFRLAVFHNEVKKLFLMCNIDTSASEEVLEKLLDLELVKILYDTQSNKLIDIENVNI